MGNWFRRWFSKEDASAVAAEPVAEVDAAWLAEADAREADAAAKRFAPEPGAQHGECDPFDFKSAAADAAAVLRSGVPTDVALRMVSARMRGLGRR